VLPRELQRHTRRSPPVVRAAIGRLRTLEGIEDLGMVARPASGLREALEILSVERHFEVGRDQRLVGLAPLMPGKRGPPRLPVVVSGLAHDTMVPRSR
jgi:hypothetical protein